MKLKPKHLINKLKSLPLFRAKSLYYKYTMEMLETPLEFVGKNWDNPQIDKIAIMIGFNPWKREFVSEYMPAHKTAFLKGQLNYDKLIRLYNTYLKDNPADIEFYIWGKKDESIFHRFLTLSKLLNARNFDIYYVEDGFIRSLNSGILHSKPLSLSFDTANHFENKPNYLEDLLLNYTMTSEEEALAERYLDIFRDTRITKYYNPRPFNNKHKLPKQANKKHILVIGQVEDDASILYGDGEIKTNIALIEQAKRDNPNAVIYFRPHPDYFAQIRKGNKVNAVEKLAYIVSPDVSLYNILETVDEVYTISSLAGFESLVHGKKVKTFGSPFYSNWGLTTDAVTIDRRNTQLTLEKLFYIAYIIYPKYIHAFTNEISDYPQTVSHLIIESLKYKNYFDLSKDKLYRNAIQYLDVLSLPLRVLNYIVDTKDFANATLAEFNNIIAGDYQLKHYPQISHLLIYSSNYDELVDYTNNCLMFLEQALQNQSVTPESLNSFLYALNLAQKNSNGRVINLLPNLLEWFEQNIAYTQLFGEIYKNYLATLSNNLQYDLIAEIIEWTNSHNSQQDILLNKSTTLPQEYSNFSADQTYYRALANVLAQKPSRSERNSDLRNRLLVISSNKFLEGINQKYKSLPDTLLNQIMYFLLLNQESKALENARLLQAFLEQNDSNKNYGTVFEFQYKRKNDILGVCNQLFKNNAITEAVALLKTLPTQREFYEGSYLSYALLRLSIHKRLRKFDKFSSFYNKLPKDIQQTDKIQQLLARYYREMGLFEKSKNILQSILGNSRTLARKVALEAEIEKIDFCKQTSEILNSVPQPTLPKGVVFLASQTCFNTLAMMTPALVELKKQGYAVVNLTEGMTAHQETGFDYIDKLSGIIPLDLIPIKRQNDWRIDWDNEIVEAQGINFYQGFYERLSTYSRRFFVDINRDMHINKQFYNQLLRVDLCLEVSNQIFNEVVKRNIPAIIISGNSHVTPFSAFRDFCRAKDHPLLSYINCNVAYESYFSNLGSKFANTMCVTDMTLYPNIRAPFMARPDQFDRWYQENSANPQYLEQATKLLSLNRVGSTTNEKEQQLLTQLETYKAQGKKIICAFGKVPVDLNVPYDGGPAHKNMSDWITHTVEICNQLPDDVILLVKPHPHELRPEIALDLVESFYDLIKVEAGKNVMLLGHKDINGQALAPLLDLALLYNGSSGVEMTAQGIPVMMASYFGKYDYPIDIMQPQSREQYESFIKSLDYPIPSDELRKRAAFLLCYLGTDEISILNQYSRRQLTNDKVGTPKWRMEKIENFLINGDKKMELIADRITEKVRLSKAKCN